MAVAQSAEAAHTTLLSLLELALGGHTRAEEALDNALAEAGRDDVPTERTELIAFVRAHLVNVLTAEIGPRLTLALMDDLLSHLQHTEPSSGAIPTASPPPASAPRPAQARDSTDTAELSPHAPKHVVLVDPDRVGRTTFARALVRAQWQVTVIDSVGELANLLRSGEPLHAAIVDADHPLASSVFEALAAVADERRLTVVVRGTDMTRARAVLAASGLRRFVLRPHDAAPEALIAAMKDRVGSSSRP